MKKLLLIWFFSGSLDGHSQELKQSCGHSLQNCKCLKIQTGEFNVSTGATPDTLRAIILVTLSPNGIAHARMGYVVIEQGKRPVYLDCRKRALKLPAVGWGWEKVGTKN